VRGDACLDATALAFLVGALIIVLGFLGEEFFKRTSVPEPIFLLLFGVILDPVLHLFTYSALLSITPYFAALALIIILFDGGLNMNVQETFKGSLRAFTLALVGWGMNVATTAVLCKLLLGWRWLNGLLLGSILGGSSSIIVVTLSRKIKASKMVETILSLESVLTDVFCTVGAFAVLGVMRSGQVILSDAVAAVAARFGVGILVGLLFGLAWLVTLEKLKEKPNAYMLTLAVLLVAYVCAESLGGTGALSALFLGLIPGNARFFARQLNFRTTVHVDNSVKNFHSQISFLIRSLFFVFIGLLFTYTSWVPTVFGLLLTAVYVLARYVAVKAAVFKSPYKDEALFMTVMLPRGLAAAVLALIPVAEGMPNSQLYPEIAFIVIFASIVVCTAGVAAVKRRRKHSMLFDAGVASMP